MANLQALGKPAGSPIREGGMGYIKYNLCWSCLFNLREDITARLFVYNE
mgnify:CR=1 FL=1